MLSSYQTVLQTEKFESILKIFGLTENERHRWDVSFLDRLFSVNIDQYFVAHLYAEDLEKIRMNREYMWYLKRTLLFIQEIFHNFLLAIVNNPMITFIMLLFLTVSKNIMAELRKNRIRRVRKSLPIRVCIINAIKAFFHFWQPIHQERCIVFENMWISPEYVADIAPDASDVLILKAPKSCLYSAIEFSFASEPQVFRFDMITFHSIRLLPDI